ncbi:uncharacterized protein G2W53_033242 [Senna tora]|uniref:Uncharacterized protein n=1 Tax=Senna tora TaxID=362788 RepID=A0A834T0S2_9FABA|nr:uncharacterized protein G2W53_033242 [Senna tora]
MVPLSERSARTNCAKNRARREEKLRAVVGGGWRASVRLREVVAYLYGSVISDGLETKLLMSIEIPTWLSFLSQTRTPGRRGLEGVVNECAKIEGECSAVSVA